MHNRVRMIVASFLVKDLHLDWTRGARHFLDHLYDGDLASNNHGWQWVAGTGTDAAPYFRIFNPRRQGERFDPDGELRPPLGARARRRAGGGHPRAARQRRTVRATTRAPIVDHAAEREEALRRFGKSIAEHDRQRLTTLSEHHDLDCPDVRRPPAPDAEGRRGARRREHQDRVSCRQPGALRERRRRHQGAGCGPHAWCTGATTWPAP